MKRLIAVACLSACAFAQSFEAASVKPAAEASRRSMKVNTAQGGPGTDDPGRFTCTACSLKRVLMLAYDAPAFRITGPDLLNTEQYDFAAVIPSGVSQADFRTMLQALLQSRFHLELHHETRTLSGYDLNVDKRGAKLTIAAPDAAGPDRKMTVMVMRRPTGLIYQVTGKAQTTEQLAEALSTRLQTIVSNLTGLTGTYNFTFQFAPDAGGDDAAPPLRMAISELGLHLEPRKSAADVLVIDHADKLPTEN